MVNGFSGSAEEWDALEAPLRTLDDVFEAFAAERGLLLSKNARNWPERSFRFGETPELLIQLFLEGEVERRYTLWVSASDHRSRSDYWLHTTLIRAVPLGEIAERLEELLIAAYEQADAWRRDYPSSG